jgi:putative DNA primase/helicase
MTLDLAAIARAFDRSANVKPGATSISVACPLCGYNASSCTITIKCGRLLVHCHAGCDQRRLFAAVVEMARLGCERPACWQRPAAARAPMSLQEDLAAEGERLPLYEPLRKLWLYQAVDVADHPVALRYLEGRRCVVPPRGSALRAVDAALHPPTGTHWPALMALVVGGPLMRGRTFHTTFLAQDGSGKAPVEPARLFAKGLPAKGVARLTEHFVEVGALGPADLGVAEGIESALSLAHAGQMAIWATLTAGNLAELPVPVVPPRTLTIAVDRDQAGERAAVICARRWKAAGVRVRMVRPRAGDVNDLVMRTEP